MKQSLTAFAVSTVALLLTARYAPATDSFLPTGASAEWTTSANWDTNHVPNATTDSALFANTPTAFQKVSLASNVTVGSITFNTTGSNPVSIGADNATGGILTLDGPGAGPVTILSTGTAGSWTGSNTDAIAATMVFNDDIVIDVENTAANGTTGGFRLGGPISGPGGVTKTGPGLMTWAFTPGQSGLPHNYSGPTTISGGRIRMSSGSAPGATSSFTINGGQLDPISNGGTYTLGANSSVPLYLSGFGPTSGPYAAFPGVIRPDTNLQVAITNNVVLQSDSMLHSQGSSSGLLQMRGNMSGPGILYAGSIPHDANVGVIDLQGSNSYTGGTVVNAGTLQADAISTNAFGSGSVQVVSANLAFGGSQAHVHISSGATNAIADTAFLNLAGGNVAGTADDGYIDLDGGVNETVAGLMLGGVIIPAGQYGSSASGAANNATLTGLGLNPDEFFAGGGVITNAASGIPGDYNNNGIVDAADYVLWRKGGQLANDFTPGNQPSDYTFWRSRFGATTNPGAGSGLHAAAVPEPATFSLFALLLSFLGIRRKQRAAVCLPNLPLGEGRGEGALHVF